MYDISKLDQWIGRVTDVKQAHTWRDLLKDFGAALLPFLIDEKFVEQMPAVGRLGQFKREAQKFPNRTFKTYPGAAWALMVHLDKYAKLPDPFFKQGFLFPLEWRKIESDRDGKHSELLPEALLELADRVKRQFAASGLAAEDFYLHPWHGFRDTVDFSKMDASFDSAWGALATGLFSVAVAGAKKSGSARWTERVTKWFSRRTASDGMLANWPFSSIAFDFKNNQPTHVSHLEKKFAIVARYGGSEIAVAPNQQKELRNALDDFKIEYGVKIRCFDWKWRKEDFLRCCRALMRCNQISARGLFARTIVSIVASVMLVVGLSVGVLWWFNRDRIRYFADYEGEYEEPVGIGEIPRKQLRFYDQYYEFVYSKPGGWLNCRDSHVLKSVTCRDNWGQVRLPEFSNVTKRPARREFNWVDGRLNLVKVYNELDQLHYILRLRDERLIDVQVSPIPNFPQNSRQKHLLPVDDIAKLGKTSIATISSSFFPGMDGRGRSFTLFIQQRDCKNRPTNIAYLRHAGTVTFGCYGECGICYQYDNSGRVKHVRYLFPTNATMRNVGTSLAGFDLRYGLTNAVVYVNDLGEPVRGPERFSGAWYVVNDRGTKTVSGYWDERGNLDYGPGRYAFQKYSHSDDMYRKRIESYDPAHRRCAIEGEAFAEEIRGGCDSWEKAYLALDNRPALNASGAAYENCRACGGCIDRRYFGLNHEPVLTSSEWAHRVVTQDCRKYGTGWTLTTLYGTNGVPMRGKDGWAHIRVEYVNGALSKTDFYGPDLKTPCLLNGFVSSVSVRYLWNLGLLREIHYSCRTDKGLAIDPRFGHDSESYIFDDYGRIVERYNSRNGVPNKNQTTGVTSQKFEYNQSDQCVCIAAFGTDRRTRVNDRTTGVSVWTLKYERGQVEAMTCYSTNYCKTAIVKPCVCNEGYSTVKTLNRDLDGEVTHLMFFNDQSNPCMSKMYGAEWVKERKYTEQGETVRHYCFDTNHLLCAPLGGGAISEAVYNMNKQLISIASFGNDGVTKVARSGNSKVHRIMYERNYQGLISRTEIYGCDDKPVSGGADGAFLLENFYDSLGRLVQMKCYDERRVLQQEYKFRADGAVRMPNGEWMHVLFDIGSLELPKLLLAANGERVVGATMLINGSSSVLKGANMSVIVATPLWVSDKKFVFEERVVCVTDVLEKLRERNVSGIVPMSSELHESMIKQFRKWLLETGRSVYWPAQGPDED